MWLFNKSFIKELVNVVLRVALVKDGRLIREQEVLEIIRQILHAIELHC